MALVRHCVVQVNQGPVGAMPYRRKVLAVTLTSGQTPTFKEQNASPKPGSTPSRIDVAAADPNRELAQLA